MRRAAVAVAVVLLGGSCGNGAQTGCDSNYRGACVPVVERDLDCSDIPVKDRPFERVGADPHNFDADGDHEACEPTPEPAVAESSLPGNATSTATTGETDSHYNRRYGFWILIPKTWKFGVESQNGDGYQIFPDASGAEIRAFGRLYSTENDPISEAQRAGFEIKDVKLGFDDATLVRGEINGRYHYEMIILDAARGTEIHLLALMTPEFKKNHGRQVEIIAKTMWLDRVGE